MFCHLLDNSGYYSQTAGMKGQRPGLRVVLSIIIVIIIIIVIVIVIIIHICEKISS